MAVLATYSDVQTLIDDSAISSNYITRILTTVDLILTKIYEDSDCEISDALLTELQKYFAAHIIASTTSRMARVEKLGEAQVEYIGKFGVGLDLTPYGQMLKLLDPCGLIAKTGKQAASIYAVKSFED
jgi:hypothetical protein